MGKGDISPRKTENKGGDFMNCDIIKDLLPVYAEGVCSDATKDVVSEHLKGCESCREALEYLMNDEQIISEKELDAKKAAVIKGVKKKYFKKLLTAAGAGVMACVLVLGIAAYAFFRSDAKIKNLPGEIKTDNPENAVESGYKLPDGATLMFKGLNDDGEPVVIARSQDGSEIEQVPQQYINIEELKDEVHIFTFYRLNSSSEPEFRDVEAKPYKYEVNVEGMGVPWFVIDDQMLEQLPDDSADWTLAMGVKTFLSDVLDGFDVIYPGEDALSFSFDGSGKLKLSINSGDERLNDVVKTLPAAFEVYFSKTPDAISCMDSQGFSTSDTAYPLEQINVKGNVSEWNGSEMVPLDWNYHIENCEFILDRTSENLGRRGWLRITAVTLEHSDGTRDLLCGDWLVPFEV